MNTILRVFQPVSDWGDCGMQRRLSSRSCFPKSSATRSNMNAVFVSACFGLMTSFPFVSRPVLCSLINSCPPPFPFSPCINHGKLLLIFLSMKYLALQTRNLSLFSNLTDSRNAANLFDPAGSQKRYPGRRSDRTGRRRSFVDRLTRTVYWCFYEPTEERKKALLTSYGRF